MTVEEASAWLCPDPNHLEAEYPTLALHNKQVQAWLGDNQESIEKAVVIFLVHDPCFKDVPSVSRTPSGSLFAMNRNMGYVQTYWDPPTIQCDHEGITYTVSTPEHVAALHTICDWPTALAYLQAHYDSRRAVKPLVFAVPDGWCADVVVGCPKNGSKNKEFDCQPNWIACQHYFSEHYDLKEVLDPEGRVASSELGEDCLDLTVSSYENCVKYSPSFSFGIFLWKVKPTSQVIDLVKSRQVGLDELDLNFGQKGVVVSNSQWKGGVLQNASFKLQVRSLRSESPRFEVWIIWLESGMQ
ncbi:hypothetical protein B0H19DRAFT_1057516 [Mycena capillaripes]|nr:hypothetical protein B0H19DRAFT_1057516 [Mycena capillaripes]